MRGWVLPWLVLVSIAVWPFLFLMLGAQSAAERLPLPADPPIYFLCPDGWEEICVADGQVIQGDTILTIVMTVGADLWTLLVGADGQVIEEWSGPGGYCCYRGELPPGYYSFWARATNEAGETFRSVVFELE